MKNLIPAIQFDQQDLPSSWYAQKKRNWETQERFRRPSSCLKITAGTEIWHAFSTTSNPLDSGWLGCLIASITKVIGSLGLGKTCEIEIRLNLSIPPNISPFFCFQNFESAERLFSHLLFSYEQHHRPQDGTSVAKDAFKKDVKNDKFKS